MSETTHEGLPRAIVPVVRAWTLLALLTLAAAVATTSLSWPPGPGASWATLLLVVVGVAVLGRITVNVAVGGAVQTTSLDEAVIVAAVALLDPLWGLAALVVGQLVVEATKFRRAPIKVVFNVAWSIVATLAAYAVFDLVTAPGASGWQLNLGLLAVACVYPLVNLVAMAHVLSAHEGVSFGEVARAELGGSYPTSVAIGGVGLVGLHMVETAPELLPLLLLPALLGHTRAARTREAQLETAEERDRLFRTIEGTSDGIALLDARGHVEICNGSFADILDLEPERLHGASLTDCASLTDAAGQPLRFDDPWATPDDPRRVVDAHHHVTDPPRVVVVDRTTLFDADGVANGQVVIVRDVTRQREVEALQADLVSRVSHELRTPITTITGFTELLLARWDRLDETARRQYVESVDRGARRMARVVLALRARASVQGNGTTPVPEDVDVARTVADALVDLEHEVHVPVHVTALGPVHAHVDLVHLRQIVDNLIVNASTYGAPPIEVRLSRQHDHVRITVRDHGPGVPEEFLPRMFEPFSQASVGDRRTARGLGLGLSIVRSLVQSNGGRIAYRAADGGGALFTVDLPVARSTGRGAGDTGETRAG